MKKIIYIYICIYIYILCCCGMGDNTSPRGDICTRHVAHAHACVRVCASVRAPVHEYNLRVKHPLMDFG